MSDRTENTLPRWWIHAISLMLLVLSGLTVWLVIATAQQIGAAWQVVEQAEFEAKHPCSDRRTQQCKGHR